MENQGSAIDTSIEAIYKYNLFSHINFNELLFTDSLSVI